MADCVRERNEKLGRIERLILSEQFAGKFRPDKLCAAAGGSMHDENGIARLALIVFVDLAERSIMDSQFGRSLTGRELKIADRVIGFDWRRIIGGARRVGRCDTEKAGDENSKHDFV